MSSYLGLPERLASPDSARELVSDFFRNIVRLKGLKSDRNYTDDQSVSEGASCLFVIYGCVSVFAEWRDRKSAEVLEPLLQLVRWHPRAAGVNRSLERNFLCWTIEQHFTELKRSDHGGFDPRWAPPGWCLDMDSHIVAQAALYALLGRMPD